MKPVPGGKGLYMYEPFENFGMTVPEFSNWIKGMGLDFVYLKMADGYLPFEDLDNVVSAIRQAGCKLAGWQYYYAGVYNGAPSGIDPKREIAATQLVLDRYKPDAWVIDAESEFKYLNQADRAEKLCTDVVYSCHTLSIPVGLTTYRFPVIHSEFPFSVFLKWIDFNQPQVYWNKPSSAYPQFGPLPETQRSLQEYNSIGYQNKPFIPIGRSYIGDGYGAPGPSSSEIQSFMQLCEDLGFPGFAFWNAAHLDRYLPNLVSTISDFEFDTTNPIPPPEPAKKLWLKWDCNIRNEPSTAQGSKTVIGKGYAGRGWEIDSSEKQPDGHIWYKVVGFIRDDMGNVG